MNIQEANNAHTKPSVEWARENQPESKMQLITLIDMVLHAIIYVAIHGKINVCKFWQSL